MFSLDSIGVSQFIYFYSKWLLLCHKLLKYEPCYDLQSKMFWHSGFKIFKTRISWLRIWSYTELMRVSLCKFFNKIFTKFWENDRFLRIFLYIYLQKSAHSFQSFTKCFSRSNHRRCSLRNGVLKNFAKFTGKHLCQSHFFNKVAGLSIFVFFRNFDIKQKKACNICFIICHQQQTRSGKIKTNKI